MFSTSVDHSPFFDENYEAFYETPGFPYLRFGTEYEEETGEKLLLTFHGNSSELVVITNKKVSVYQIPSKKSFLKMATGKVIDQIPVVSDVLGGLDDLKDVAGGAKNFKGWITGKNKKEKLRRLSEGLPSKKQFKNVEWDLRKPEGKAMVLSYSDKILMVNGFNWKYKFEALTVDAEKQPITIEINSDKIRIENGKKKIKLKLDKKDVETFETLQSQLEKLNNSCWNVESSSQNIFLKNT